MHEQTKEHMKYGYSLVWADAFDVEDPPNPKN